MKKILFLFGLILILLSGCTVLPNHGGKDTIDPSELKAFLPPAIENYIIVDGYPEGDFAGWGTVAQSMFKRIKNVHSIIDYDGDVMVSIYDYKNVRVGDNYFKAVVPPTAERKTFTFKDGTIADAYKMRRSGGYEYVVRVTNRTYIGIVIYTPLAPGDNEDEIAKEYFKEMDYMGLRNLALARHNDE